MPTKKGKTLLERQLQYTCYLDDSSDEETERELTAEGVVLKEYSDAIESLGKIKLDSSLSEKLDHDKSTKVQQYFVELQKLIPDFFTPSRKAVKSKILDEVKSFSKKIPNELKEIHKVVIDNCASSKGMKQADYIQKVKQVLVKQSAGGHDHVSSINLVISCILLDFGIRLLISDPVIKLYYPQKLNNFKKLSEIDNLPGKDFINNMLKSVVKSITNTMQIQGDLKTILSSEEFEQLKDSFTTNKRLLFKLDILDTKFQKLAAQISNFIASNKGDSIASRMQYSHLEQIVDFIAKKASTDANNIGTSDALKRSLLGEIEQKFQYYSDDVREAVSYAYHNLPQKKKKEDLLEKSKARYKKKSDDEDLDDVEVIYSELTTSIEQNVLEAMKLVSRPIVPYAVQKYYNDFIGDDHESPNHITALLVFMRVMNCSIKRFVKNVKEDKTFDGAEFSRAWGFNEKGPFYVIENISLTTNLSLSQMVQYSSQSSYNSLLNKLKIFMSNYAEFSEKDVAISMKCILHSGSLEQNIKDNVSTSFQNFLYIFTYHLFFTEVQRHPAAAIHHAMGLDLIINEQKNFEWVINNWPMALEKACPSARFLQVTFRHYLKKSYFYNIQGETLTSENIELHKFVVREKDLVNEWFQYKDLDYDEDSNITQEQILAISGLCADFFGIDIN